MSDEQATQLIVDRIGAMESRIDGRLDRLEDKLEERLKKNGEQDVVVAGLIERVENLSPPSKGRQAGIFTALCAAVLGLVELFKKLL